MENEYSTFFSLVILNKRLFVCYSEKQINHINLLEMVNLKKSKKLLDQIIIHFLL